MKPQTSGLLCGKLKHKVLREPVGVALNGKIQGFGGNTVEFGQVCIEHDLLAADQVDAPFDQLHGHNELVCGGRLLGHCG